VKGWWFLFLDEKSAQAVTGGIDSATRCTRYSNASVDRILGSVTLQHLRIL
jgi:hypothetical protein